MPWAESGAPGRGLALAAALLVALASPQAVAAGGDDEWSEQALLLEVLEELEQGDPFERLNRATYRFNLLVESLALDPPYRLYRDRMPQPLQRGVYNFFQNLQEPVFAATAVLEGDLRNAGVAGLRFTVNSTAGLLGLMDVARHFELQTRKTDLGALLCRYGAPAGPYLVLPVLGSSSVRDLTGRVATNSLLYGLIGNLFVPYYAGKLASEYVHDRPGLDQAMAGAIDPYVRNRALFRQREAGRCGEEPESARDYRLLGEAEPGEER